MIRSTLFLFGLLLMLPGCDLFGDDDDEESRGRASGVVVANGGNFGSQNGSVSVYDIETETVRTLPTVDAFVQRIAVRADTVYAAGNTFSKGFVTASDLTNGQRVATYAGSALDSPRSITFVDDSTAYVPSLSFAGADGVVVVNTRTNRIVTRIPTGYAPETLALVGTRAYVGLGGFGAGTRLAILDTTNDTAVGVIDIGCDGPTEVLADDEGEILVACTGNTVFNDDFTQILERTNGQILVIDPVTNTVTKRIALDEQLGAEGGGQYATFSSEADELYVLASGSGTIYRFDTVSHEITAALNAPADASLIGLAGVAYDADAERLYVTRFPRVSGAPSYESAATLVAYDRAMAVVTTATVGPAPTHVLLVTD